MSIYSDDNHSQKVTSICRLGVSETSFVPNGKLSTAVKLISEGQYQAALDHLKSHSEGMEANDLKAVLLMRLGRPAEAVSLLRPIVFDSANLTVKPMIPDNTILNFATSLLLTGHVGGCLAVLDSIADQSLEGVRLVRSSIRQWEKSLSLRSWFDWKICGIEHVSGNFPLNHEPGVFNTKPGTEKGPSLPQVVDHAGRTSSTSIAT